MTKKQFWMKMDQMAGKQDKLADFVMLIRQAYDEDLMLPLRHSSSGV